LIRANSSLTKYFYPATFDITDRDVKRSELLPNLLVFRITDDTDSDHQYHNGYEVVVLGDLRQLIAGLYKAVLLNEFEIEVELPTTSASFLHDYETLRRAMAKFGHLKDAAVKAHTIARGGILKKDSNRMTLKILIRFRTGEKLTNAMYTPQSHPYGEIDPEPTPYTTRFTWMNKQYENTELFLSFKVSRVEEEVRMSIVTPETNSVNRAAERLIAAATGMNLSPDENTSSDM
jgi:hypothetical protein